MGKVNSIALTGGNTYYGTGFYPMYQPYSYSPYNMNIPFYQTSYSQPMFMPNFGFNSYNYINSFWDLLFGRNFSTTSSNNRTTKTNPPLLSVTSNVNTHKRRPLTKSPHIARSTRNPSTINSYISKAMSYNGMKNTNEQCNRLFSPSNYRTAGDNWYSKHGNSWAWCVDFVRWNAEQTFGNKLPKGMSSSVYGVKKWGDKYNCYTAFPKDSPDAMKKFAINNIKPGNILLMDGRRYNKETGQWYTTEYGHVAIVTDVNPTTGEITTIEGNVSNSVGVRHYTKNEWHRLTGVVSLEQFA